MKTLSNKEYYNYYKNQILDNGIYKGLLERKVDELIDSVSYIRIFKQKIFLFSTHVEWFSKYLLEFDPAEIDNTLLFKKIIQSSTSLKPVYCLWSYNIKDILLEFNHTMNLNGGFDIYSSHRNYIDVLGLAGKKVQELHDYCINNLPELYSILDYIREQTKTFKLNYCMNFPFPEDLSFPPVKKLLSIDQKEIYLTDREYECLEYLVSGLTNKTIAKELSISPRTVEVHLNNIKTKTGVFSREAIIRKFLSKRIIL